MSSVPLWSKMRFRPSNHASSLLAHRNSCGLDFYDLTEYTFFSKASKFGRLKSMKNNKTRWILVAVIAAVVAAATTALVLILRARAKKTWYEDEALDYDLDDGEYFDFDGDEILPTIEDADDEIIEE